MEKTRLFIALSLDDFVLSNLKHSINKFRQILPEVKWFNETTMHLTIKFFGKISLMEVRDIDKAVKKAIAEIKPFSFVARGIGAFPNLEKPRVFWAGIDEGKEEIVELAASLDKFLQESYGAEIRKFVPHVTIGRINRRIELSKEQRHEFNQFESKKFGVTTVNGINLYSSELTSSGPVYSKIDSWKFI